ncbi:MAG: hypothetical protein ABI981_11720 [Betaproteobacteria bacterium]
MNKLLVALCASAVVFGSASALADDSDMRPLTKAQTDAARNERAAARAKFAAMTPAEQDAMRKAARAKKQSELTMLEAISQESGGVNNPTTRAEAKANVEASKMQAKPTAAERQKDLTTLEKKAGPGQ